MMAANAKSLKEAEKINLDRCYAELDRQVGLSRRQRALLAAAGEAEPNRRWYVLRVADRSENAVDNALENAGVERWLPSAEIIPPRRGGRKYQTRRPQKVPYWPGYIFVKVANTAHAWAGLAGIEGVVAVLGTAERPAPIDDDKLLKLKMSLEHDEEARAILADAMKVGQAVRVTDGPFSSFEGTVMQLSGFDRLKVELGIFGRACLVDLDLAQVVKSD